MQIHSEDFTFPCNGATIAATIDWNAAKDAPAVLSIHGSRPSNRQNGAYITAHLARQGMSCLRFDLSGHGDSTGDPEANVQRFVEDAVAALQWMAKDKPLTVIGASMGAHMAVELLSHADIQNLVLICPAIYSASAMAAPYSVRGQWPLHAQADILALEKLDRYRGRFLHIIGEHDDVIPPNITEMYKRHTRYLKHREFVVLPGIGHSINTWYRANPERQPEFTNRIAEFIR